MPFSAQVGGNTLILEATDAKGTSRKRVQAFQWSTKYHKPNAAVPKSGMVDPGLGVWLGSEVLDDGDHSLPPDDLATIFELVMASFDIGALLPSPAADELSLAGATYDIFISNMNYAAPTVALGSKTGALTFVAVISGITADLYIDKTCTYSFPITCIGPSNMSGDVTMTSIVLSADVQLSVNPDHSLNATPTNVDVALNGLDINLDGFLGGLVEFFVGFFQDGFVSDLESSFNSEISNQLAPILASALSSLAFDLEFEMPSLDPSGGTVPVNLKTDFSYTSVTASGAELGLRAGVYAPKATPYDNLGALGRGGCGSGQQTMIVPGDGPIELVFPDDTLNELLYAAWNGGLLEFDVPPSLLGDVDLSTFGVSEIDIRVSGMLAPAISDCNATNSLTVHIGDLRIDADLTIFGTPLAVVMYAALEADVTLVAEDGQIGLQIGDIEEVYTEVTVDDDSLLSFEAVIDDLIQENLVPALLGSLGGDALGGFPLPEIDLSTSLEGLPPGTGIAIAPQGVTRSGGNSIITGDLQ